jgi:hypothetical protein
MAIWQSLRFFFFAFMFLCSSWHEKSVPQTVSQSRHWNTLGEIQNRVRKVPVYTLRYHIFCLAVDFQSFDWSITRSYAISMNGKERCPILAFGGFQRRCIFYQKTPPITRWRRNLGMSPDFKTYVKTACSLRQFHTEDLYYRCGN